MVLRGSAEGLEEIACRQCGISFLRDCKTQLDIESYTGLM